ncbi:bifunctional methylenetetrahydrofolate dehydrogenase/cyclohydrolase [Elysia marginata]|uniref:methenyltetrahydrofolate cyclohydrolase n=1 Tax=Elysia marginata TaxID=1093978 RepID=A0AAV4ICT8_9GAST|nr:bifunctional methylenetetrahydrofolate dehydrogenase/cyclohydrolase [Elysia marginata]
MTSPSRHLKALRIDGKAIALDIKNEIKAEVEELAEHGLRAPQLTVILVGNDPASVVYVRNKAKAAEYTGIKCEILRLPDTVTESILLREIEFLNSLPDVDGILVQLPLPKHINERKVCDSVRPDRDVDGFNVLNVGRFCVNEDAFMPATPSGVLEIIRRLGVSEKASMITPVPGGVGPVTVAMVIKNTLIAYKKRIT